MTPAARVQAAIEVLDQIATGTAAEQALTNWARRSRFAGSKDRAAVRDHVFDALRRWRSSAAMGGAETGRGRMIGLLRGAGADLSALFTGDGHAPAPLTEDETTRPADMPEPVALDCPDWLWPRLSTDLGAETASVLAALQNRAPVFVRVNTARSNLAKAIDLLAAEGIICRAFPDIHTALQVIEGERKISQSKAYSDGVIELQDAASQAACLALGLQSGDRVLDYCAGGGGKALAMAAQGAHVTAHDINTARMRDIGPRAARAGVRIDLATGDQLPRHAPFDLVLCDAPCSGSGTWRRAPEAKWRLTPDRLNDLCSLQAEVLAGAAPLVAANGRLAYATCSVLADENAAQVARFCALYPGWTVASETRWLPGPNGDGFYLAVLQRL